MTTMIVDIQNSDDARKIAEALRLMKSVKRVFVQEESLEAIAGVPRTQEELTDSVVRAMQGYRRGEPGISQQELRRETTAWK